MSFFTEGWAKTFLVSLAYLTVAAVVILAFRKLMEWGEDVDE